MARDFYKEKIQEQWNEPTFCSLVMTATFEQPPTGMVEKLYYGEWQQNYRDYTNRYLTVLYLGVILYCVIGLVQKRDILQCLLLIGVIGGFLFSILWEAKSRYVLPYIVLLIPYMALGLSALQAGLGSALGRLGKTLGKRGIPEMRREKIDYERLRGSVHVHLPSAHDRGGHGPDCILA